jgi:endonuclease III
MGMHWLGYDIGIAGKVGRNTSVVTMKVNKESSCELGNVAYKSNLKKLYLQLQHLHIEFGRQICRQVSLQSPCFWWFLKV